MSRSLLWCAVLAMGLLLSPAHGGDDVVYRGGVVAADHPLAAQAGAEMLRKGGNAVDAAVAASFALSVVRPYSCGIGGGGFMIIYDPETNIDGAQALDYRETAPAAMGPDYFSDINDPLASRFSGDAVGTPGTVAGLLFALDQFGNLTRAEVVAPAIALAEQGYHVDAHYVANAKDKAAWFEEDPRRKETHGRMWRHFLKEGEIREGDLIRLPGQAKALKLIAENGAAALYHGPIGEAIVRTAQQAGGALDQRDLADYSVSRRTPLTTSFRGHRFLMMPPPSSGGIAIGQILGILGAWEAAEGTRLGDLGHNSAAYAHLLAEAFKHAFADRAEWLADSDFVSVPIERLLSEKYVRDLVERIEMDRTAPPDFYGSRDQVPDDAGTSHISVIDGRGMAVSCTETINLAFGSRLCVEPYDFFLNNEIDDFTTRRGQANAFGLRQSEKNLPAPGKKPLSSMSPTIAVDPQTGRVELIAGASGGPRIITGVAQATLNALVFDMTASEAVDAPRFHHQWIPNTLMLEPHWTIAGEQGGRMSLDDVQRMMNRVETVRRFRRGVESRGHRISEVPDVGVVQMIRRAGDGYQAASDPRKGGAPAGIR